METSQSSPPHSAENAATAFRRRFPWLPTVLLLSILPLCFLGFGSDNDTYEVLDSGYSTWHLHIPQTSRNPGYWVYEAITHFMAAHGGSILTNLGSFAMAVLVAWRFWKLALRLQVRYPALLTACLVATPGFIIAATSTDDYLWSLLFLVLGAEMMLADRLVAATLLSAFAMAIRGGNGPVVAGGFAAAIGFELYTQHRVTPREVKLAVAGVSSAALAAVAFYPSYHLAGNSMSFTQALEGPHAMYTPLLRVGKFLYKGSVAVGPLALIVLLVAAVVYLRRLHRQKGWSAPTPDAGRLAIVSVGYLCGNAVLFFCYPIEFYYLIPATFFLLLLAGVTVLWESRPLMVALLVSILSFNFVWPIFVRPDIPGRSTGARLHFGVDPGILVFDTRARVKVMGCHDYVCFYDHNR